MRTELPDILHDRSNQGRRRLPTTSSQGVDQAVLSEFLSRIANDSVMLLGEGSERVFRVEKLAFRVYANPIP